MSIGSRIKELREIKNISRNEFAEMIGVTVSAISNYENGVSFPKEPILFKIIEALDCDANYLFQDVVKLKEQVHNVTLTEYEMIKKYRLLNKSGKDIVKTVLDREFDHLYQSDLVVHLPDGTELLIECKIPNSRDKAPIIPAYAKAIKKFQPEIESEIASHIMANVTNKCTRIEIPENADTSKDDIMNDENI